MMMIMVESRKMFMGPIENDQVMHVKIGEKLQITTNQQAVGKKGIISVKNCAEFPPTIAGKLVFFDMGSICA
jgi:hypothetical protein